MDIAPADIALAPAELGLVTRLKRETILQKALSKVSKNYDVCLVDCPPSLSLLTVNAIAAAEGLLIPVQAQPQDVRGLALYMSTLEGLRDEINPDLVPRPDLCVSCKKDGSPGKEEILCNLTRAGQQGKGKFRCEAYEPIS